MTPEESGQEGMEERPATPEDHLSAEPGPEQDGVRKGDAVSKEEMGALSGDVSPREPATPPKPTEDAPSPSPEEPATTASPEGEETEEVTEIHHIPEGADESAVTESFAVGETEPAEDEESVQRDLEASVSEQELARLRQEVGEKPAVARRFPIRFPRRKTTVSVTAGLIAGIIVAGLLTAYRARELRDLAEIAESEGGLLSPLDKGRKLIEEGKYGSARELLERFVDETPQSAERAEGLFLLADAIQALQKERPTKTGYTEAREAYRKAIDADPSSPRGASALENIARTYLAEEMYEEARDTFEEAVRKYPATPDIAELEFEIGTTYLMQKDGSAAIRELTSLIADYPDAGVVPRAKLSLAMAFELEQRYDRASKLYQELVEAFPQDEVGAEAQERLGDLAFKLGNYPGAVTVYKKRVQMPLAVTDNDRVLLKLARTHAALGNWVECASSCRTILELFEQTELEPEVLIQLSHAEEQRGHIDAAIQYAYEGRTKFTENADLAKHLADLYFRKEDYAEAARLYDEVVKLAPDDSQAWFRGGLAHFEAGDLESSSRDFREVTERFPSDALAYDAYLKLADILYLRGDPQRAIDVLSSRLPEHIIPTRRDPILSKIARIYLDLGLPGQAADTYAKMLDGIDDDEILARVGIASLQAERWKTGLTALRSVNRPRLDDDLAYTMLVEMGVGYRSLGNLQGAIQSLQTAINDYPAHRDERGVIALLRSYLASDEVAEARKLVSIIESWAAADHDRGIVFCRAALVWGDYLYSRGDYLGAIDQFAKIETWKESPVAIREWATYQRANAYFQLARYDESVAAYERFLENYPSSAWKEAAETRLDLARLEIKLRDRKL